MGFNHVLYSFFELLIDKSHNLMIIYLYAIDRLMGKKTTLIFILNNQAKIRNVKMTNKQL